jgi:formamidopyrimidine-DNA glycosylase
MPELPEVETIARALRPELVGREISSAQLLWPKTLATPSEAEFMTQIRGRRIADVSRRGKFLQLELQPEIDGQLPLTLFIHLRMSGDMYVKAGEYVPEKHDRLILALTTPPAGSPHTIHEGGGVKDNLLVFNDTRKFGRVWLTAHPGEVTGDLGPEPLDPALTPGVFHAMLRSRRRQLKPLLLDQTFLAGLGNIYTDEVLHMARLHPLRSSDGLTVEEANALWNSIRETLRIGIENNGASIDWVYRGGGYQHHFRAYGRTGKPCPVCGTPIERILVGQRSTHFCPGCQPRVYPGGAVPPVRNAAGTTPAAQ